VRELRRKRIAWQIKLAGAQALVNEGMVRSHENVSDRDWRA